MDDVLDDLRRMDVRGYTEMATDRRHWRRLVLDARVHVGCSAKEEENID